MRSLTTIMLTILLLPAVSYAQEHPLDYGDYFDSGPVITDFIPDSNFTLMSYALPNNPRCQLIHDNHLYQGAGAFLQIYELGEDGLPSLTFQVQARDIIWDMEHDGEYLYLSNGLYGLTIYEGNNFTNPAEISNLLDSLTYGMWKICVSGDSLYYSLGRQLGVMNISDRASPFVERVIEQDSIDYLAIPPNNILKYQNYLIFYTFRYYGSYRERYVGMFDITAPSGIPEIVDSVYISGAEGFDGLKLFENRLYIKTRENLHIYEIEENPYLNYRSSIYIWDNRINPRISGFTETDLNDSRIGFLGIRDFYPDNDSSFTSIHALLLDDLTNPVFIDSTAPLNQVLFSDLCQQGYYTYGIGNYGQYVFNLIPGLFVLHWTLDFESEQIGHYTQYSYCYNVEVNDNIAYASTVLEGIIYLDVTDKSNPQIIGEVQNVPKPKQMEIDGDILYILTSTTFRIYDITEPLTPTQLGMFYLPEGCYSVNFEVYDDIVYICHFYGLPNDYGGLMTADISDPEHCEILYEGYNLVRGPNPMDLAYPRLYMLSAAYGDWYVRLYNITNPEHPARITDINDIAYNPISAAGWNDYLYVFGGYNEIYDLSDPWHPLLVWQDITGRGFESLVCDNRLYLWTVDGGIDGVYVWDIESDPSERRDIGFYQCYAYRNIVVEPPYVYVAGQEWGMITLRFDDPTSIEDNTPIIPKSTELITAYPNPFNSSVLFTIQTEPYQNADLKIYDITGRLVKTFEISTTDNKIASLRWDGNSKDGQAVSSGVYFARYSNEEAKKTIKVVLLR